MGRSADRNKVSMQTDKLRLGIFLDSLEVPAWAASALQRIAAANSAEFSLVILNNLGGPKHGSDASTWLYSAFSRLDRKIFSRDPDAFTPTDISGLLAQTPTIHVVPAGDRLGLSEKDILAIKQYKLDILAKIGFDGLPCDDLRLAKYGIWTYYHGDDTKTTGGPAGFWEVVENRPETVTALITLGADRFPKRVLYRSFFTTYPLSPARHRNKYFWAAASFLPRQVEYLQRFGEAKFWQNAEQFNSPPSIQIRHYETPSTLKALVPIGRIVVRQLKELFQRSFYLDQWFLLLSLDRGISDGFKNFETLTPPRGTFWADPHTLQRDGKYYVFIEEYLHAKDKGVISVIELDDAGKWKPAMKVLEKDYHLSYPFVFEWDGKSYMVPESGGNRTIDLYESTDFPYKWQHKQTLMENVKAVDTTLIYHSGKWWLFTAIAENPAAAPNVELFLFYSDDLLSGRWTPHPSNPIVSDVKRARPAGSLFVEDGKLFRPSQYCSTSYGYGFDLNEIERLSESEYCERTTMSVRPDWDKQILATHTYSKQGRLTVIDAFKYAPRIW